jgi:glycine/D-amino acid oxidase-like deaminating enzyme
MSNTYDAIVIGSGHNGLVSAAYLARSGARTLVLESRGALGGAATTEAPWEDAPHLRVKLLADTECRWWTPGPSIRRAPHCRLPARSAIRAP